MRLWAGILVPKNVIVLFVEEKTVCNVHYLLCSLKIDKLLLLVIRIALDHKIRLRNWTCKQAFKQKIINSFKET